MNAMIVLLLGQDGIASGAIYALLALSIVLVFSVTRVLLIPQGEFVTFGAMSMAAMENGKPNPLGLLLLAVAVIRLLRTLPKAIRLRQLPVSPALGVVYACAMLVVLRAIPALPLSIPLHALVTMALIVPMGPMLYDTCFRPIASAHGLVLLVVAIALHVVLVGISLFMFGAEGAKTTAFLDLDLAIGSIAINAQAIWIAGASLVLVVGLFFFFERSLYGKALRATAIDRFGAELMGVSPSLAGQLSFGLAAFIGALSGILIAPMTTLYYDSGFLIGLKGFVGAIIGGLTSYPLAAFGAVVVGLVEAYSTFWASDYKEVMVFTLILPFLLWRSLRTRYVEDRP